MPGPPQGRYNVGIGNIAQFSVIALSRVPTDRFQYHALSSLSKVEVYIEPKDFGSHALFFISRSIVEKTSDEELEFQLYQSLGTLSGCGKY